jgi:hypothetical protein
MPLIPQVIALHDAHQTTLHQDPEYISDSQLHQTTQLSTSIASFNAHLSPSVHAKVVQNQVTMTPMERFEDPSAFPYQQHSTYEPLPNYSYDSTPQYETPTPYQYSGQTSSAQTSPEYSTVRSADQEPQYSENYAQSWTATEGSVDEGDLAGVRTQFDY